MESATVDWLLAGDPAIVWQVERDLLDVSADQWMATRERIAHEGWGARLLAQRSEGGRWTGGLYSPKWTSTTYTLLQLWRMGLPRDNRAAVESTELLLDEKVWVFGDRKPYWEACVAGFGLALSGWFTIADVRRETLLEEVLENQLEDGGWNCRSIRTGSQHGSFHTTINVLEGLREYCSSRGSRTAEVEAAEARGREFFSVHHLYRSHRTGRIPDERMTRMPFPPRWHHDVLRGLDYFRAADASRDERLADPIDVVVSHRRKSGRWPIHQNYAGKVWFNMESGRQPSRWNTLRALRVLRWWAG